MTTPAEAGLRLCNKSKIPIAAAGGYPDQGSVVTEGWWNLWPGDCAEVTPGRITHRYYYYRANTAFDFFVWGGDEKFCVGSYQSVFKQRQSDACSGQRLGFNKVDTGPGSVTDSFTQELSCSDCMLPRFRYDKASKRITAYHVISKNMDGVEFVIPITAYFDFALDEAKNEINGTAELIFHLADLKKKLVPHLVQTYQRYEECGDRFSLNTVGLQPLEGNLELSANASYARWLCTYMDLPETECEDTWVIVPGIKTKGVPSCTCKDAWIKGPFGSKTKIPGGSCTCEDTWIEGPGVKTKGVPKCTTKFNTRRTSKNVVLRQGGELQVSLRPSIVAKKDIQVSAVVTKVRLDGFGQNVVDLFRIDLKSKAQSMVDAGFDASSIEISLPPEIRGFTELAEARFFEAEKGLWLRSTGTFKLKSIDILKLCKEFWPAGKCSPLQ